MSDETSGQSPAQIASLPRADRYTYPSVRVRPRPRIKEGLRSAQFPVDFLHGHLMQGAEGCTVPHRVVEPPLAPVLWAPPFNRF